MAPELNLDEGEHQRFEHAASGYGVVITGGTPDDREAALRDNLDGPLVTIDCREMDSMQDIYDAIILNSGHRDEEHVETYSIGPVDASRALTETGSGVLVLEFEELDSDDQTSLAQFFKGVAERRGFEGDIGYACREPDSVVRAERDLSMRIQSWQLE